MTQDYNPADWDWEKLQIGLRLLELAINDTDDEPIPFEFGKDEKTAYEHTVDFVRYHIDAGEILSPLQTYLTEK
jgi:hypothetical protein